MNYVNKLVLGTVQFGLNYGINNSSGQVPEDEVYRILSLAKEHNIHTLDTSSAYGNSEEVLGKTIGRGDFDFKIVSKYPQGKDPVSSVFFRSLKALRQSHLYAYLVHHFDFYRSNPDVWEQMMTLKANGSVDKIGFSIYTTDQLQYLLDRNVLFDIIQFPYNIFDRQFDPYLSELKRRGVEIHTRSVFLQGLFFRDVERLTPQLQPLGKYLQCMDRYCKEHAISKEMCALSFVLQNPYIDGVLIGVDNVRQLQQNIQAAQCVADFKELAGQLIIKEKELLNPSNWK